MLDKYNLVQSSMAQMDSTIACANGKDGIPSISGTASTRFNEDDKETTGNNIEFRDISASITNLGASEEAAAKINAESNKATAKINAEASEATAKINAKASEATAKINAKASKQASNAGEKAATQRAIDKLRKEKRQRTMDLCDEEPESKKAKMLAGLILDTESEIAEKITTIAAIF